MNQSENRNRFSKNKKLKTAHELTGKRNSENGNIYGDETRDWISLTGIFANIIKYPLLYSACIFLSLRLGMILQKNMSEEEFCSSRGNIYFLLGNLLFLLVYNTVLLKYGRSIRTECSFLRDFKLLYHNNKKGIKAKFARLAKRSKKIFSKDVTARRVGVQYLYHWFAGLSLGALFTGLFLLLNDPALYIKSFDDSGVIRTGGYEYVGIFTFVFVIPFIEELIYHAHNMTVLRRDFTALKSSSIVMAIYLLFHFGNGVACLFVPVIFLINLIYDRTQNTRGIADYVAGRSVKSCVRASRANGNIISLKDKAVKVRRRRYKEKSEGVLGIESTSDCSVKEDLNIETRMAEAVNDFNTNGVQDVNAAIKITDFYSERLAGSKPDITYSFLMNTGFHFALSVGWIVINHYGALTKNHTGKQLLIFMVVISVFIIYKFIKKQHMFEF